MRCVPAFLTVLLSSTALFASEGDPLGEDVRQKKAGVEGILQDATNLVSACAHGTEECKAPAKKDVQTRVQAFAKGATEADWDPLRRLCTVLVRYQAAASDPLVAAGKACVARVSVLGAPRAAEMVRANKVQDALDFADSIASDFGDPAVKLIDAAITKARAALCVEAEKKALEACGDEAKSFCGDKARKQKKACDDELKPQK
jgi:hypothetical protein